MDKFIIEGGVPLRGEVRISGSKNSALPIMAACLLTEGRCIINNVPNLKDISTMVEILRYLGVIVDRGENNDLYICANKLTSDTADYSLVSTMRGSFCVLGPILARLKKARVAYPGGCAIGVRPVDLHINGLKALGARIELKEGYVIARGDSLKGNKIFLGGLFGPSVLATANIMMAATLAEGKTIIESAACEPEIEDLGNFLNKMQAKVSGHGTPRIEIEGVEYLSGAEHTIISDRIEAATFMMAALITRGSVEIVNIKSEHLGAVIHILEHAGASMDIRDDRMIIRGENNILGAINVAALPYPGLPTDVQAQLTSLLSLVSGMSVITDKVFPDRFVHIAELNRMGANIQKEGSSAIIQGVKHLSGAEVMASDLRASACLVLAGLAAKGTTVISRIYHLDRGYERMEEKLKVLGARIIREK